MDQRRRRLLAVVGTGLAAALAGCGSGDDGATETEPETESPPDTATETATPTAAPTSTPSETATPTATATPQTTEPPPVAQTVAVGPGSFSFAPESFTISAGDTVRWVWESSNHNVRANSTPSGSDWRGTPGDRLYDEGHTYTATFEVAGEYAYHCVPHRDLGMTGSFTVTE